MFDRNNFKEFVISQESLIKEKCSIEHPKVQYHGIFKDKIWSKSFRSLKEDEFSKLKLIGSLKDPKLKMLHYVEFSNSENECWTENYKIATNFYPYNSSNVYQCKDCNRLFIIYTENGGHFPQERIREVKKELIIEQPGSCVLKLSNSELKALATFLNYTVEDFETLLNENKKIRRVNTDFQIDNIIVSELFDYHYLIVGKNKLIYDVLNLFEK